MGREWYMQNTYNSEIFDYFAPKPLVSEIVDKKTKNKKGLGIIEENKEDAQSKKKKKLKKKKLTQLNLAVEKEVNWLYSTIGTVLECNIDRDKKNGGSHQRNGSYSMNHKSRNSGKGSMILSNLNNIDYDQGQIEIDWEQQEQS